jgi:hypothetical protein
MRMHRVPVQVAEYRMQRLAQVLVGSRSHVASGSLLVNGVLAQVPRKHLGTSDLSDRRLTATLWSSSYRKFSIHVDKHK